MCPLRFVQDADPRLFLYRRSDLDQFGVLLEGEVVVAGMAVDEQRLVGSNVQQVVMEFLLVFVKDFSPAKRHQDQFESMVVGDLHRFVTFIGTGSDFHPVVAGGFYAFGGIRVG